MSCLEFHVFKILWGGRGFCSIWLCKLSALHTHQNMFSRGWRWGLWVNGSTEDVPSAPPHVLAISTVSKSMCSICLPQPKTDDTSPTPIREFFWVLEVGFRVARWVYKMIFCMHGEKSLSWSNPAWPNMESHKAKTRIIFLHHFMTGPEGHPAIPPPYI